MLRALCGWLVDAPAEADKEMRPLLDELDRVSLRPKKFLKKLLEGDAAQNLHQAEQAMQRGRCAVAWLECPPELVERVARKRVAAPLRDFCVAQVFFLQLRARAAEHFSRVDLAALLRPGYAFCTAKLFSEFCDALHFAERAMRFLVAGEGAARAMGREWLSLRVTFYRELYLRALKALCARLLALEAAAEEEELRALTAKTQIFEHCNEQFLLQLPRLAGERAAAHAFAQLHSTHGRCVTAHARALAKPGLWRSARQRRQWLRRLYALLVALARHLPREFGFLAAGLRALAARLQGRRSSRGLRSAAAFKS